MGGIKGIGPKKALKLIQEHKDDFNTMFKAVNWDDHFDYSWEEVFRLFKEMPVEKDYSLRWNSIDPDKVRQILCEKHDFSNNRVDDTLEKLTSAQSQLAQKGLGDFM